MSNQAIKKIVLSKLGNAISDEKAERIITKIQIHEASELSIVLKTWENQFDLPDWVKSEVTINETFFFRHPEQYSDLKKKWVGKDDISVLCVGVSSGEEAYSIAMIFEEMAIKNYKINGIDLDPNVVAKARQGRYPLHQLERTPEQFKSLLTKYGETKTGIDGACYWVNKKIMDKVEFNQANILTFFLRRYDLVFVRNILIYFCEEDKARILKRLKLSLKPDGSLVFGSGELLDVNAA